MNWSGEAHSVARQCWRSSAASSIVAVAMSGSTPRAPAPQGSRDRAGRPARRPRTPPAASLTAATSGSSRVGLATGAGASATGWGAAASVTAAATAAAATAAASAVGGWWLGGR